MRENRETPAVSRRDDLERSVKGDRTTDMHAAGESDDSIVPAKRANNGGTSAPAESVEGRGSANGNTFHLTAYRTQSRTGVSHGLEGVRRGFSTATTGGKSRMR